MPRKALAARRTRHKAAVAAAVAAAIAAAESMLCRPKQPSPPRRLEPTARPRSRPLPRAWSRAPLACPSPCHGRPPRHCRSWRPRLQPHPLPAQGIWACPLPSLPSLATISAPSKPWRLTAQARGWQPALLTMRWRSGTLPACRETTAPSKCSRLCRAIQSRNSRSPQPVASSWSSRRMHASRCLTATRPKKSSPLPRAILTFLTWPRRGATRQ
mmetsp:Transcript_15448/g.49280  ORF Transcript_15448/g.49280 Transcript_15448/m.49280 type:complete len:214 (+) Transcript_15448:347-988(+)